MNRLGLFFAWLIAIAPVPTIAEESVPLGRLFFTPEKRLALERQRIHNVQQAQALQGVTMSLDGVVYRPGGKSTVWINRQAQSENDQMRTGVKVVVTPRNPGRALISPGEDKPERLNVGEAINRTTGERNNRLGGGNVTIQPTPATKR